MFRKTKQSFKRNHQREVNSIFPKGRVLCKVCGHRILPAHDRMICHYCGVWVYRDEKAEFKYKMLENVIKERRKENGNKFNGN